MAITHDVGYLVQRPFRLNILSFPQPSIHQLVCGTLWGIHSRLERPKFNILRISNGGEMSVNIIRSLSNERSLGWRGRYLLDGMGHVVLNSSPGAELGCETFPS